MVGKVLSITVTKSFLGTVGMIVWITLDMTFGTSLIRGISNAWVVSTGAECKNL